MMTAEITYQVKPYPGDNPAVTYHTWTISGPTGETLSELYVDQATSEIRNVWTREDARGQGLASALYRAATATHTVLHAAETHRTPDGAGWASIVGGDTAPCTDGCCTTTEE